MRRYINNCHGTSLKVQCPYCNKTHSQPDDLIRHHIISHHPEKMAEVQKILVLLSWCLRRSQRKIKQKIEQTKKEDVIRQENTFATTSLIGRLISPITDDGKM